MPNGKPTKKPKQNSQLKKFHQGVSPLFHLRKLQTDSDRKTVAVIQGATSVPITFSPPQKQAVSRLGTLVESPMKPLLADFAQVAGTPSRTPPKTTWQTPGGTELELSARHCRYSINGSDIAFYSSKKETLLRSRITTSDRESETDLTPLGIPLGLELDCEASPASRFTDELQSPSPASAILLHQMDQSFLGSVTIAMEPIEKKVEITESDLIHNTYARPRARARTQNAVLGIAAKDVPNPKSIPSTNYAQDKEILHMIGYSICPAGINPQSIENFVIGSAAANTQMMISEGLIHKLLSYVEFKDKFERVFYTVTIADYDKVTAQTIHGLKEIIVAKKIISIIEVKNQDAQLLFNYRQEIDVFGCGKPPVTDPECIHRAAYLKIKEKLAEKTTAEIADVDMTPRKKIKL